MNLAGEIKGYGINLMSYLVNHNTKIKEAMIVSSLFRYFPIVDMQFCCYFTIHTRGSTGLHRIQNS